MFKSDIYEIIIKLSWSDTQIEKAVRQPLIIRAAFERILSEYMLLHGRLEIIWEYATGFTDTVKSEHVVFSIDSEAVIEVQERIFKKEENKALFKALPSFIAL